MSKSTRLERIEERLAPKRPQKTIVLFPPGRYGDGWTVGNAPKSYATEEEAIEATYGSDREGLVTIKIVYPSEADSKRQKGSNQC